MCPAVPRWGWRLLGGGADEAPLAAVVACRQGGSPAEAPALARAVVIRGAVARDAVRGVVDLPGVVVGDGPVLDGERGHGVGDGGRGEPEGDVRRVDDGRVGHERGR